MGGGRGGFGPGGFPGGFPGGPEDSVLVEALEVVASVEEASTLEVIWNFKYTY